MVRQVARNSSRWLMLLLVPWVAILWVPLYNRIEPRLFGFPCFYWYQLLWVILGAAIVALVYCRTRRVDGGAP